MRAAWYEKQGAAREVLTVGEMPDPHPGAGEVRIRIAASGINPGDIKKRQDSFGLGMPYSRVVPHSDGAGQVHQVGDGESPEWVGRRVWCYGAQSYRPFGTAAEFTVLPADHVALLPENVVAGGRRLSWDTRHYGPSCRACGGRCRGEHRVGARGRGCRRNVRGSTGAPRRSACDRHGSFIRRRTNSARGRRSRSCSQ